MKPTWDLLANTQTWVANCQSCWISFRGGDPEEPLMLRSAFKRIGLQVERVGGNRHETIPSCAGQTLT